MHFNELYTPRKKILSSDPIIRPMPHLKKGNAHKSRYRVFCEFDGHGMNWCEEKNHWICPVCDFIVIPRGLPEDMKPVIA